MSCIFKTQGGGGGMYASILVKGLSETDIVTAINGSKTKTAVWNAAESRWEFTKIADLGMWTVTATDGEKTKTQDVLVDAATEYEIEMDLYKTYLYNYGDECEDITGGWDAPSVKSSGFMWDCSNTYTSRTATKNDDNLYLKVVHTNSSQSGTVAASFWTKNAIDLTDVSALKVLSNVILKNVVIRVRKTSVLTTSTEVDVGDTKKQTNTTLGESTAEMDVSDLTGLYCVGITAAGSEVGTQTRESKTYSVWLE